MPKVEVIVGPKEHVFEMAEGENLLFESISRSVMIPFNCTSARCGTCRIKVIEGEDSLSEVGEPEVLRLGEERVDEGYRLACQAYVHGDIKIEVPQPRLY
ncbi:2Fe-2S iron-sulfur cluster-binding protein [Marininema halotolerans]|uniref:Ferredoxin n=1 Tax=Marininema halotolerans TaxID=1155944 RepID=A0A1I6SXB9_9BACL|nr:2Fe-2S iron-sulfur cluster-binding protein [Marininema halotolerans]SFS81586.1 Ferredoxin [Marininema halotolerans]